MTEWQADLEKREERKKGMHPLWPLAQALQSGEQVLSKRVQEVWIWRGGTEGGEAEAGWVGVGVVGMKDAAESGVTEGAKGCCHHLLISVWKEAGTQRGFPGGSGSEESACNAEDPTLIPVLGRSLEKEMAIHSSILDWRIPWTEGPGGLQSMGSQRLGHN